MPVSQQYRHQQKMSILSLRLFNYLKLQDPALNRVVTQEFVDGDLTLLTHTIDPVTSLK